MGPISSAILQNTDIVFQLCDLPTSYVTQWLDVTQEDESGDLLPFRLAYCHGRSTLIVLGYGRIGPTSSEVLKNTGIVSSGTY